MAAGINREAVNTVWSAVKGATIKQLGALDDNLMQPPIQPERFERVRRQFTDAHGAFSQHNAVFKDISARLLSRLAILAIEPCRVLDLGCRDGYQLKALQHQYPDANLIGVDPACVATPTRWWQRKSKNVTQVTADPHQLPFIDGSFDLVVSNLLLPWCHEPGAVFAEVARVLADNGAFMFTSAGPDTLQEYSELWRSIDSTQHVFGLADMHQTGDELLSAGFSAPVLDREVITIDYPSIDALQDELRYVGAANLACGRRNGLMASNARKLIRAKAPQMRFSVTLELVQGHGWKGSLSQKQNNSSDEFSVSLDSLRQSLRGSGS